MRVTAARSLPRTVARVALRVSLVAVVLVVLVGSTAAQSGEQSGRSLRATLAGQDVRLNLPTGDRPKGLVIWFHGQGGNVNDRIDGAFFSALRRDGWAVASSDFHEESWGNEDSTEDTERLVAWAEDLAGVPAQVWVAGSMGGSVSLNAMLHGVTPPRCWYGIKPALDLRKMQNVPGGTGFIRAAYDGPAPLDRVPVANIDDFPDDIRYRVVASPEDTWVPIDQNGGAFAYGLDQRGIDITYLPAEGDHDDPSHFVDSDVVSFADDCLDLPPASVVAASD